MKLNDYDIDYLLVNTTNQFLLEYAPIEENSCYKITGFSGDTGDALVCPDNKIILFVDGRYHTQADLEVDKSKVSVYKLKLGEKHDDAICASINPNSKLGIVSKKVSQKRYEYLKTLLKEINVEVVLLKEDIVKIVQISTEKQADVIDKKYTGQVFKDKIKQLETPSLYTNSEEITYLTNLRDFNQDYAVKIDGKLLIDKNMCVLYTDVKILSETDFIVKPLSEFEKDILGYNKVYVDKTTINAYDYALIKTPIHRTSPVKLMKSVKTKEEIKHLKYCFEMTDKALLETRKYIEYNNNLSEYDIDKELTENFKKFGAKILSFKSIVARNKNSALAHYMKSSKDEIINEGDLILIDCGAYYGGGLATDITRVFVKGTPSNLQRRVYTTVLKMFLNAFNYQIVEGETTGFEIDGFVHKYLEKNSIEGFSFSHGLGHGIGICVHEAPPNLSKNEIAKSAIKNNMCFTIEPGLYNENEFGVRLENSCYLENGVIKSFSDMCYEEKLIDYNMLTEAEKEMLTEFKVL